MRRIIPQVRKEITQIRRDRFALVLASVLPLVLLAMMGTAISLSVTDLPVVVQDLNDSAESRAYIESLRRSLTFRIVRLAPDEKPETALLENRAKAALIVPGGFASDLRTGRGAEVQFLIDASDANTANIIRAAASRITMSHTAGLRRSQPPPINAEIRLWFNPGAKSSQYIAPNMLAVGLSLFPPLLAALAMSREGEHKTILQVYVSSISAHEYLLGKIIAYFLIAVIELLLSLIVAYLVFGLYLRGDPTAFIVSSVIYLFCTVSFGAMVGVAIPNQAAAIQAVQIGGFLLSFLLSGAIYPVSNIPFPLSIVSMFVPARHYISVVGSALIRGTGWDGLWHVPFVLAGLGGVFFLLAWKRLRRMQIDS